ncbi:hypothetical protein GCM10009535_30430 [Streptomyces thermocarboxydovorans]|uniref:Uncharacterized protein n=1 Tax=Streptomyces thermocarboxydovorans TaxID=59298 RepID=A0ABN1HHV1_9ACTN
MARYPAVTRTLAGLRPQWAPGAGTGRGWGALTGAGRVPLRPPSPTLGFARAGGPPSPQAARLPATRDAAARARTPDRPRRGRPARPQLGRFGCSRSEAGAGDRGGAGSRVVGRGLGAWREPR